MCILKYLLIFINLSFFSLIFGQTLNIVKPPRFGLPRYLEDYSSYRTIDDKNLYLKLKYLPISKQSFLSIGGETRLRYEYYNNYLLGLTNQDNNGYLLERYLFHADFHHLKYFRIFSQIQISNIKDRYSGPRGLDKDVFDIHQLFIEIPFNKNAFIRIGRQEVTYGSNRWICYRDGPNSRLSFNGIRIDIFNPIKLSAFYFAPIKINRGSFDNKPDNDKKLLGLYSTINDFIFKGNLELYLIYNEFPPVGNYLITDEKRISFGFREIINRNKITIDFESTLQYALISKSFKPAYSFCLDIKYKLIEENDRFNLGFYSLINSGNYNARSTTFQPLFPALYNFRTIGTFGKYNLTYIEPFLQFRPLINDRLLIENIFFWRSSKSDNVYSCPGLVLVDSDDFKGNFLGTQMNFIYTYYWNDFLQTEVGYRMFFKSSNFNTNNIKDRIDYITLGIICRI
jgi:hypothetical protein